jgi:formylglycine-generating enzyme required for sulfatase activity
MKITSSLVFLVIAGLNAAGQKQDASFAAYKQQIPGTQISFPLVPVKGGTVTLGSPANEPGRDADEGPQHKITVAPFWMGAYEVSRDEFDLFFKDQNTSQNSPVDAVTRPSEQYVDLSWGMGKEGGFPVNSMSQFAALMYCRWLYNKTGVFYRLPTEAEWEYACRAGSNTAYYFGNDPKDLDKYAWNKNNSNEKFQKSGQKLPNAFGLYDMLGNVSEWTLNHYVEKAYETLSDGFDTIPSPEKKRYPKVIRGGSYLDDAAALRSANRQFSDPQWNKRDPQIPKSKWWLTDAAFVGFRIVRPLKTPTKEEADAFYLRYLGR